MDEVDDDVRTGVLVWSCSYFPLALARDCMTWQVSARPRQIHIDPPEDKPTADRGAGMLKYPVDSP